MKKTDFKFAISILSFLLVAVAPAIAVETNPSLCRDNVVDTEAGLIHFDFVTKIPKVPYLSQSLGAVNSESNTFELANGSKWSTSNVEMVKGWGEEDELLISQNQAFFSTHRYALINVRLAKAVPISLIREPKPDAALYVTNIDYANDVVTLNKDGQQWEVYSYDHGTLRKFSEHDRILIGVNTSDCCDHELVMRYLLINTTTNQSVRAAPLAKR